MKFSKLESKEEEQGSREMKFCCPRVLMSRLEFWTTFSTQGNKWKMLVVQERLPKNNDSFGETLVDARIGTMSVNPCKLR